MTAGRQAPPDGWASTGGYRNPQGGWSGPVPFNEEAFLARAFVSASGKLP